jgi:hypothetical protein
VERKVCRHTVIGALPPCGFRLLIMLAETGHIRSEEESYLITELYMLLPCYNHRAWTQDLVPDSRKSSNSLHRKTKCRVRIRHLALFSVPASSSCLLQQTCDMSTHQESKSGGKR